MLLKKNTANPARKSAHHTIQSKNLRGLIRQIRGAIIRLLTESVALPYESIILNISKDEERVKKILYQLYKEEMIVKNKDLFQLPH